jgi:WD40 repeat protein
MKKAEYVDIPHWEIAHPLPHLGSLSATDVRTLFCISETRAQAGTHKDGSAAYQLFWEVRAISWPGGRVIAKNSFTGAPPLDAKALTSSPSEGAFPYPEFAAWVFGEVDHADFFHFREAITTVAISPDGKVAAFGSAPANQVVDREYQAKIWILNPSSLQVMTALEGHQGIVTSLAFSPDGKTLASAGADRFVKFWDRTTNRLLGQVNIPDAPNALTFSTDGQTLAVATNLEVFFINPSSRRVNQSIQETGGSALAFSPGGSDLYVHASGRIKIIDLVAGRITLTFPDPFALVPTLSVPGDGTPRVTYESPEAVEGFALSPDGKHIVTYTVDRTVEPGSGAENVRLASWDADTGKYLTEARFPGDLIRSLEYSPDGRLLAVGNASEIWLWDTASWQVRVKLAGHVGQIVDLAFPPEETFLLSAGSDGTIRRWFLKE